MISPPNTEDRTHQAPRPFPPRSAAKKAKAKPTTNALLCLLMAAALVGGWGANPAQAQSASPDPPSASPSGEGTTLVSQQQKHNVQSVAGGQEGKTGGGSGGPISDGGIDLGSVRINEGCVQAGDITIGDCKDRKPGEGGGDADSPQKPSATSPESASPEPTSPEPTSLESASPEASTDPSTDPSAKPDAAGDCAAERPKGKTSEATVERVIDGDTVELAEPVNGTTTVRFIGVDTPETVDPQQEPEPFGEEASAFTQQLEGEKILLELGRDAEDDYDRLLAYPWTEDENGEPVMFSEALLEGGYGELLIVQPNDAYEDCLAAAERRAKEAGVGLWGLGANDPEPDPAPQSSPPSEPGAELVDSTDPAGATPSPSAEPSAEPSPEPADQQAPDEEDPDTPEETPTEAPEETPEEPVSEEPAPRETAPEATAPRSEPSTEPSEEEPLPTVFGAAQEPRNGVQRTAPGGDLAFGQNPEPPSYSSPAAEPSTPSSGQYATDSGAPQGQPQSVPPGEPEIVLPDSGGREIAAANSAARAPAPSVPDLLAFALLAGGTACATFALLRPGREAGSR